MKKVISILMLLLYLFSGQCISALTCEQVLSTATDPTNGYLRVSFNAYDSTANTNFRVSEQLCGRMYDSTNKAIAIAPIGDLALTGDTTLTGAFDVVGDSTVTGAFDVIGDSTITGTFDVVGDSTITGTFDVVGDSTVTGTFDVIGNSSITATTLSILNTTESSGGLVLNTFTASSGTLTGATDTIEVNVPSGSILVGAQLRVDTLVSDTAGDDTWSAEWNDGASLQAIAAGAAAAKNTKVNALHNDNANTALTDAETDIVLTPNGGNFDAGEITAVVYYWTLGTLDSAP